MLELHHELLEANEERLSRTPSLALPDSHMEHMTGSSPLITTTTVDIHEEDAADLEAKSPSRPHSDSAPEPFPGFLGTTATASGPPLPENSKKRGVSPARRLKDAFTSSQDKKSPGVSPDRRSSQSSGSRRRSLLGSRRNSLAESRAAKRADSPPPPLPKPLKVVTTPTKADENPVPRSLRTPPATSVPAVVTTTVTPPTPTEPRNATLKKVLTSDLTSSPESIKAKVSDNLPPGTVVSPSGNMISHRRARSASATGHTPSKLSQATSISPTTEESRASGSRTPSASQSGFFSSVFSAAQNAASTISSSLGAPAKNRGVTQQSEKSTDGAADGQASASSSQPESDNSDGQKKELAVKTLGSGDLNFSHLDIDAPASGVVTTKDGVVITRPDLSVESRVSSVAARRDEMSARIEDMRAARAVSMAYEKSSDRSATPPVAGTEDGGADIRSSSGAPLSKEPSGEQTPNGSVFEGETGGSMKRTSSVRDRLSKRRHRGSSGATGSTIGAIGMSAMSLGMPGANTSVPRLTGFAVASKKRNRDFHQLFRSVPEDDFLIEDYSCALQREIILAGRIYISEGHICFSSNILGWVTTLVISFDEIVAIEKETTAMVFPNAIAIQTLHARHTFRSLLSREATYDLMVNIWKINHPSLKSYVNGVRIDNGHGDKTEKADESDAASDGADEDDEIYDEDEDNDGMGSVEDAGEGSLVGSETAESVKPLSRKTSALTGNGLGISASTPALPSTADAKTGDKNGTAGGDASGDFPGPATHPPTELNDPAGRYDKVVKDDIIPAPLGKVYNLVFGPASGAFMTKFLVEEQKSTELQFEDDKKGLNNENKTRQYSYIKPLNGSIGPKQTKCISTETLDFFDLEKAVLVTLATQTPDVPSGNVFCVKTKYLFTWAAGNQTRFFMSCTIEWSGKSWLKGPIEKGAIEGQTSFGNDLVKALKAAVAPRSRTDGAKGGKAGKGRRKKGGAATSSETAAAAAAAASAALEASKREAQPWGVLEPLRGPLGPIVDVLKPLWNAHVALGIIGLLLFTIYSRGPTPSSTVSPEIGYRGLTMPQRLAAYEEMWWREETELWNWLEERVGMDGYSFPVADQRHELQARRRQRRQRLRSKDLAARLNEERMSEREVDQAIRVTRERLDVLEEIVNKRKSQRQMAETETSVTEEEQK